MLNFNFDLDMIKKFVQCVENAVSDDIVEDVTKNDLRITNSVPSRIWDFIFSNLIRECSSEDFIPIVTIRGPWKMVIVYEKTTNCIFTFMREKRFLQLKKQQHKRKHMHYIDILSKQFNDKLKANNEQMSMYPIENKFSDFDKLNLLAKNLLKDLGSNVSIVKNHVLVLFDSFNHQLMSIRAVMITPNLEIADGCEEDWSQYIRNDSVVVSKITDKKLPENNPNRGLKLTAKATAKQKKHNIKFNDQSSENIK